MPQDGRIVDRMARDKAAALARGFWLSEITNRRLEKEWPETSDLGVRAVEDFMWILYDDFKEHQISVNDKNNKDIDRIIDNSVLFLKSDYEYRWPAMWSGLHREFKFYPDWLSVLTFGVTGRWNDRIAEKKARHEADVTRAGDLSAWPFLTRDEIQHWLARQEEASTQH